MTYQLILLDEFDPERLAVYEDNSRVIWADKTNSSGRTIVMTTLVLLQYLATASKISVDGTFFICSSLWQQLFILIGLFGETWVPLAFGLLPGRAEQDYTDFFELLNSLVIKYAKSEGMKVKKVICDFERAIHNSITNCFGEETEIFGFFFHFRNLKSICLKLSLLFL